MIYKEYEPQVELAPYVQLVLGMQSEGKDDHFAKEVIMPDGIVELVLHYADPLFTYPADAIRFVQPQGFAISQMRNHIAIESNGAVGLIAVRFFPWGAHHFITEPISNFLDDTIDLRKLWPEHSIGLLQTLHKAYDLDERADIVQQFLATRQQEVVTDDSIDSAIKLLRDERGHLSIEELCERTGFSTKQLERKFITAVGTTPKVFARISRFLYMCHNIKDFGNKTLTELCYDCGYYDQSHFIKEFRTFSGFTPKEFFARNDLVFANL